MGENKTLASMLSALTQLEREIDNAEEITLEACEQHFAQFKEASEKTDRLIGYMDYCKMNAAHLSERAEALNEEAKKWERRQKQLEEYALWILNTYPQMKLLGSYLYIDKKLNPPKLKCDLKKRFSSESVIPDELIFSVPEKYRECRVIWTMKNDVLKDDLKAGKTFNFASLTRDEKLVIKPKLKELNDANK